MTDPDPLQQYTPDWLVTADEDDIDWEALANEIGEVVRFYHLPTTPDGEPGPWLDKLELCQDVARHIRDGGTVQKDVVLSS